MQAETFDTLDDADLSGFLDRVGEAQVVLLGEMTHGTSEFYRMRARMTEALVREKGFGIVALEADWPDAAAVDAKVRRRPQPEHEAFDRWPPWMWKNEEFRVFADRLRELNDELDEPVAVRGLDLYSMGTSIDAVIRYLDERSPRLARAARDRYGCLARWQEEPERYGAALRTELEDCEDEVVAMLGDMLQARLDGEEFFDAQENARVVQDAEAYYRSLYQARVSSWNVRDGHMADTLASVLEHAGPEGKAVVWAHNSHVGDSHGSELRRHGETTLGTLCRERFPSRLVGFFTHEGSVMAADAWDLPGKRMQLQPSRGDSHGDLLRQWGRNYILPMEEAPQELHREHLERAVGVIYRPDTERHSHHFGSVLTRRYDEVVWMHATQAVRPLERQAEPPPATYPSSV